MKKIKCRVAFKFKKQVIVRKFDCFTRMKDDLLLIQGEGLKRCSII